MNRKGFLLTLFIFTFFFSSCEAIQNKIKEAQEAREREIARNPYKATCDALETSTANAILVLGMQGYSDAKDGMYPYLITCMLGGFDLNKERSEELKKKYPENFGTTSYDDFMMIWHQIGESSMKVAEEFARSGNPRVPGIVPCEIDDSLLQLMGYKFWNDFRTYLHSEGISPRTTRMIHLPTDICNLYSKSTRE